MLPKILQRFLLLYYLIFEKSKIKTFLKFKKEALRKLLKEEWVKKEMENFVLQVLKVFFLFLFFNFKIHGQRKKKNDRIYLKMKKQNKHFHLFSKKF